MIAWAVLIALAVARATYGQAADYLDPNGTSAESSRVVMTDCEQGVGRYDSRYGWVSLEDESNTDGFQSERWYFTCAEAELEMRGRWTIHVENGLTYRHTMGRLDYAPPQERIGDPTQDSYWGRFPWCCTRTGWELCADGAGSDRQKGASSHDQ